MWHGTYRVIRYIGLIYGQIMIMYLNRKSIEFKLLKNFGKHYLHTYLFYTIFWSFQFFYFYICPYVSWSSDFYFMNFNIFGDISGVLRRFSISICQWILDIEKIKFVNFSRYVSGQIVMRSRRTAIKWLYPIDNENAYFKKIETKFYQRICSATSNELAFPSEVFFHAYKDCVFVDFEFKDEKLQETAIGFVTRILKENVSIYIFFKGWFKHHYVRPFMCFLVWPCDKIIFFSNSNRKSVQSK